jgi:hypothetical protein
MSELQRLRDALSLVQMALSQHSEGPKVAAMRIAGNGPTVGQIVRTALSIHTVPEHWKLPLPPEAHVTRWKGVDLDPPATTYEEAEARASRLDRMDAPEVLARPQADAVNGVRNAEPDDVAAERFCALVNWHPDGTQNSVVEGAWRSVTFRELAKGYIRSALAAMNPRVSQ